MDGAGRLLPVGDGVGGVSGKAPAHVAAGKDARQVGGHVFAGADQAVGGEVKAVQSRQGGEGGGLSDGQDDRVDVQGGAAVRDKAGAEASLAVEDGTDPQEFDAADPSVASDDALRTLGGMEADALFLGILFFRQTGRHALPGFQAGDHDLLGTLADGVLGAVDGNPAAADDQAGLSQFDLLVIADVVDAVMDPLQIRARQVQPHGVLQADGDEDGIKTLLAQVGERQVGSDRGAEFEFDPQFQDGVDLVHQDCFGEAETGDAGAQHAARLRSGFEDGDPVAEYGQVVGGGQSGRAGTDDGDPGGRFLVAGCGLFDLPKAGHGQDVVAGPVADPGVLL